MRERGEKGKFMAENRENIPGIPHVFQNHFNGLAE